MKITQRANISGEECLIEYEEIDDLSQLPDGDVTQVYGLCFCDGKLVLVHDGGRDFWTPVGGTPESGESIEQALHREVQEESNMEVISWRPIGFQRVTNSSGSVIQVRVACLVRPFGEFVSDPDGDIDRIALINLDDYRDYFNWSDVGEAIVKRAKELMLQ